MRGPEADSPTGACWVADGIAYTLGLCGLLFIGLTAPSLLEFTARAARGVARSPEWTVLHELTIPLGRWGREPS